VRDVVRTVAQRNRVVGIDVVELAPALDASGLSALVTARLAVETIAEVVG
jgi:agmatinase